METLSQKLNESLGKSLVESLQETLEDILIIEIEKMKEESIEAISDN